MAFGRSGLTPYMALISVLAENMRKKLAIQL